VSSESLAGAAPDAGVMPAWVRATHAVSRALGVLSAGLILLSVAVVCHMVFVRAVLGQSSIWQTEFVTFALVSATFLGAPYILLTRGHVAVDVVPLMVATPARRRLHGIGTVIGLAFCGLFLWGALPWWHEAWSSGQTTASIWRARLWIPYLSVPVGLAILCLQLAADGWMVWTGRALPFGLSPDDRL
jgi:TRAP-type C4-dicarboxylate transport system permease small subunit